LALFESGIHINRLSTGTLALTAVTAVATVIFKPMNPNSPHPPSFWLPTIGFMSASFLFAILQQYLALRVRIDLHIFRNLHAQSLQWKAEADRGEPGSWENSVPEEILAEAIHAIKDATPSVLMQRSEQTAKTNNYLDPYRRTARLYYKQATYAICQLVTYWLYLVCLILPS